MKQTKVTARHDDTINRVLQENHIQPGSMIEYLESRLHYIQCSGLDLKHEVEMGLAEKAEPGFYEKLFAELNAEMEMVESIIAKLKEERATNMREVTISFNVPDPGEHIETESKEYQDYYDEYGPHIQLCGRLDDLLRKADLGYIDGWESDDGHSYCIVAKGVNEMVLKETIIKALAENDHGLQYIEVFTQTEMDLHWAESDALVAKALAEQAEWDAKPQEEQECLCN